MSSEAIKFIGLVSFMLVGAGSFIAGYLSRYLLSDDYDRGYQDGFERGRKHQKIVDDSDKL